MEGSNRELCVSLPEVQSPGDEIVGASWGVGQRRRHRDGRGICLSPAPSVGTGQPVLVCLQ